MRRTLTAMVAAIAFTPATAEASLTPTVHPTGPLVTQDVTPYGQWAIPPYIVRCESRFRNLPPNYAGASGYYQIIPSTWRGYGGGRFASAAYRASKYGQDVIAGRIWRRGGASQWDCA